MIIGFTEIHSKRLHLELIVLQSSIEEQLVVIPLWCDILEVVVGDIVSVILICRCDTSICEISCFGKPLLLVLFFSLFDSTFLSQVISGALFWLRIYEIKLVVFLGDVHTAESSNFNEVLD